MDDLDPIISQPMQADSQTDPPLPSPPAPQAAKPSPIPDPQTLKPFIEEELLSAYNPIQLREGGESEIKTEIPEEPKPLEKIEPLAQDPVSAAPMEDNSGASPSAATTATAKKDLQESRRTGEAIFHLEVEKIKPNPHQPRRDFDEETLKELAASIQEFGILQPLVVSKIEKDTETGTAVEYQLIAGERRLRAAQMLGWERVPAIIRSTIHKSEQLELAIVENLQRADLSPIETARAYAKLQDEFGLTQREVASRLGKSREAISNTLRLLSLPTEIQDAIGKNQLNESQGRLLLMIEDPKEQHHLFEELLHRTMSVRELRSRIRGERKSGPAEETKTKRQPVDQTIKTFEEELRDLLGAQVKIEKERSGDAGKIIISFYSPEEIEGIINKLHPR